MSTQHRIGECASYLQSYQLHLFIIPGVGTVYHLPYDGLVPLWESKSRRWV